MSSPQIPALQEAFNTFDEDGSGFVDLQELIRCLRCQPALFHLKILSGRCTMFKTSDYCCRSLNVNHVTDAQIERRFKEVSPVVLVQAYNQDFRMYLAIFMTPVRRRMWMAVALLILQSSMASGSL